MTPPLWSGHGPTRDRDKKQEAENAGPRFSKMKPRRMESGGASHVSSELPP